MNDEKQTKEVINQVKSEQITANIKADHLDLRLLKSAEGLKLPNSVSGNLDLRLLKNAESLKLPTPEEIEENVDKIIQGMEDGTIDIHGNPTNNNTVDYSNSRTLGFSTTQIFLTVTLVFIIIIAIIGLLILLNN